MTESNLLDRYRAFFLDIDGVLVRGGEPISSAAEAIVPSSYVVTRYLLEKEGPSAVWTIGEDGTQRGTGACRSPDCPPEKADWLIVGTFATRCSPRRFGSF